MIICSTTLLYRGPPHDYMQHPHYYLLMSWNYVIPTISMHTHPHLHTCSGHTGLWLDEYLFNGTSQPCSTFENDCLSSKEEFTCTGVEAWGFM